MVIQRIQKHLKIKDVWATFVVVVVACLIAELILVVGGSLFQRAVPVSYYYTYEEGNEVVSAKENYNVGENPFFISHAVYYRTIDMRWEDTLLCVTDQDDIQKFKTQVWEERKYKSSGSESWGYFESTVPENVKKCQICGNITGTTERGHKKTLTYCSNYFNVTNNYD